MQTEFKLKLHNCVANKSKRINWLRRKLATVKVYQMEMAVGV